MYFFYMKMGDLKTKKRRFFVLNETLKIWLFFNANILNDLNDRDVKDKNYPTISEGRIRN